MVLSKRKRCTSSDTHLGKTPDRINPITIWKSWEWKEPDGGLTAWPLRANHTSLQLVTKGLPTSTLPLAWLVLDSNRLWLMELWFTITKTLANLKAAKYKIQKPSTCHAKLFCCKFWADVSCNFHLAWSMCHTTKTSVAGWRKLLQIVKHVSTLSSKFAYAVGQVEGFCISYFTIFNSRCGKNDAIK